MSLKDQMPFFSNPPPWYSRMVAVLLCVGVVPFVCISVMCLLSHEYWPVLIFAPIIFFTIWAARGAWRRALQKEENERFKSETKLDA